MPSSCPICYQPVDTGSQTAPFCSWRCQRIDLGQWLDERYHIPGEPVVGDDLASSPAEEAEQTDPPLSHKKPTS